jgi:UDP-glucose 4-epimerase
MFVEPLTHGHGRVLANSGKASYSNSLDIGGHWAFSTFFVYLPDIMARFFVTGGAGFIGSNVVDRLLADGHAVTAYDNFSTGQRRFLAEALAKPGFRLVEGDMLDESRLADALVTHDFVFHFAANADVRFGTDHPRRDLEQNTIATCNLLEAMRGAGVKRIGFSSTGSVYGEPNVFPTPETCPFPIQTSLYAASKLAGEALIQAYCAGFGFQGYIFRFVSILGPRYSHGHVFDFYRQLSEHPDRMKVLGDGKQRKSYLHVYDCVDALLTVIDKAREPVNIFNLGTQEHCAVDDSIGWISAKMGVNPRREYSGGERGWIGDSPFIFLETTKARSLGWKPTLSIRQGVESTVDYLQANQWLFESR